MATRKKMTDTELLDAQTKHRITVECIEPGRWTAYQLNTFGESVFRRTNRSAIAACVRKIEGKK
jgi:hypothetical protein